MSQTEVVVAARPSENPPKRKKPFWKKARPLLWATVIVPTLAATVYFGLIASHQYISESSFVVRSAKNQASLSGLGAVLQSAGFARSQDDIYTVQNYMRSRSALGELSKKIPVRSYYEDKGDAFARFNAFGFSGENEAFYEYFAKKVVFNLDSISGISTLQVTSFDAAESERINRALLKQGEALINQINERARRDTVHYAEKAVGVAEERVKEAAANLTAFRSKYGVFDLQAQSQVQMGLVSKLQDELIMIQTQLDQVRSVTPDNPQIPGLQARERSLRREISQQMNAISGGGSNSLTQQAEDYQRVFLENELAQKQLAAAITSLESAKAEAERQQLYLEVISAPSVPDLPQKPHRFYNILATFIIGLIVYGILTLLTASIREHKN